MYVTYNNPSSPYASNQIMVTRTFCDFQFANGTVIRCDPRETHVRDDTTHIIIASDGLWDMLDREQIRECLGNAMDSRDAMDRFASQYAENAPSAFGTLAHDDMSAIVFEVPASQTIG
jgi:serine/threonine protein phosphatase PrpC